MTLEYSDKSFAWTLKPLFASAWETRVEPEKQSKTEVEIITESQKLLKNFKTSIINDINIILKLEKNVNYKNKIYYSIEYDIDFELITHMNFSDLYPIIQNLQAINILRYINDKTVDDNLCFIIRYLLCFNYFKYHSLE